MQHDFISIQLLFYCNC